MVKFYFIACRRHEDPPHYFLTGVSVDIDGDIGDIYQALVDKHSGAESAFIYKPNATHSFPVDPATFADLLKKKPLADLATILNPAATIREVFGVPSGPALRPPTLFAILAWPPAPPAPAAAPPPPPRDEDEEAREKLDVVGHLLLKRRNFIKEHSKNGFTPSKNAKSVEYNKIQGSPISLLDGRYNNEDYMNTSAPPIELYHPVFGRFKTRAEDTTANIPLDIVRETADLMRHLSAINRDEQTRDSESRKFLARILGVGFEHVTLQSLASADYMSIHPTASGTNAGISITEVKKEMGEGGSDPSVQGSFSYAHLCCQNDRAAIRDLSCCPAFIIGLAGPWIVILGGVITTHAIIQRLTAYEWLGCSRALDDAQVLRVARLFYALRQSLDDLKTFYSGLPPQPPLSNDAYVPPQLCPCISSFHEAGRDVTFTYMEPLELEPQCVTFKAIRQDTDEIIVVKFVRGYGKDAHALLAEHEKAPKLIAFEPLGADYDNLNLVVMGYVDGQTLQTLYPDALPQDVRDCVASALKILNDGGFVFGDLRKQNVMLADGPGLIDERIRFIDFDWAGKEGPNLRYPFHLSQTIREASKALDYTPIRREHQDNMFKKM